MADFYPQERATSKNISSYDYNWLATPKQKIAIKKEFMTINRDIKNNNSYIIAVYSLYFYGALIITYRIGFSSAEAFKKYGLGHKTDVVVQFDENGKVTSRRYD